MTTYEISVWEDYYDNDLGRYCERRLAIIGQSNMRNSGSKMEAQCRARDPKLVNNVNGTNTFTFTMYYSYISNETGEIEYNPYVPLLINERKIKVFWRDEWYDFVIKDMKKQSDKKTITYTCKDLFINELSKNGYNIEFADELQNNMGTAPYLADKILKDTDWQVSGASEIVEELREEAVYEIEPSIENDIRVSGHNFSNVIITPDSKFLIFYSWIQRLRDLFEERSNDTNNFYFFQCILCKDNNWKTENDSILVTNGQPLNFELYPTQLIYDEESGSFLIAVFDLNSEQWVELFRLNLDNLTISNNYRAERQVYQQLSKVDPKLNKVVDLYTAELDGKIKEIYKYSHTEFDDYTVIQNIVVNPSNFTNTKGWHANKIINVNNYDTYENLDISWEVQGIVPSQVTKLKIDSGAAQVMNMGLEKNYNYIDGKISVGQQYVLHLEIKNATPHPYIGLCTIDENGVYSFDTSSGSYFSIDQAEGETNTWIATCIKDMSVTDIQSQDTYCIGFTLDEVTDFIYITNCEFYRLVKYNDGSSEPKWIKPGEVDKTSLKKTVEYYYLPEDSAEQIQDIKTLWVDTIYDPPGISQIAEKPESLAPRMNYHDGVYERIRSIKGEKSNRYNLLQTLAETFQCWVRFEIEHEDNGAIKYDESEGRYLKNIIFKKEVGTDTGIIFSKGIDLKSLSQNYNSDQLVTKVMVQTNETSVAKNGICTIQRADENPSKDSFILNFDYYVSQGLLDRDEINLALYDEDSGYLPTLRTLNTTYDAANLENYDASIQKLKVESLKKVYWEQYQAAIDELQEKKDEYLHLTGHTWGSSTGSSEVEQYTYFRIQLQEDASKTFIWTGSSWDPVNGVPHYVKDGVDIYPTKINSANAYITYGNSDGTEQWPLKSKITLMQYTGGPFPFDYFNRIESENSYSYNLYLREGTHTYIKSLNNASVISGDTYPTTEELENDKIKGIAGAICELENKIYNLYLLTSSDEDGTYDQRLQDLEEIITTTQATMDQCLAAKNAADLAFWNKYSRFIQEGTWNSSDYYDDNLYYLAAENVLRTSSKPQFKFDINVISLESLEEFNLKKAHVGDIGYVEDVEFLGMTPDNLQPRRERVLISETTFNLDSPQKDAIKVQNYKTRFEDLFQRITASTESLKAQEGSFARTASQFSDDGSLKLQVLQEALTKGSSSLNFSSTNDCVVKDETGITVVDTINRGNQLKVTSGGIAMTEDGKNWTKVLDAKGVRPETLREGSIQADEITIMNKNNGSVGFRWTGEGIGAYTDISAPDNNFVKMNQEGITMASGSSALSLPSNPTWNDYLANDDIKVRIDRATGNVKVKGDIYADNGYFNGVVNATGGIFSGAVDIGTTLLFRESTNCEIIPPPSGTTFYYIRLENSDKIGNQDKVRIFSTDNATELLPNTGTYFTLNQTDTLNIYSLNPNPSNYDTNIAYKVIRLNQCYLFENNQFQSNLYWWYYTQSAKWYLRLNNETLSEYLSTIINRYPYIYGVTSSATSYDLTNRVTLRDFKDYPRILIEGSNEDNWFGEQNLQQIPGTPLYTPISNNPYTPDSRPPYNPGPPLQKLYFSSYPLSLGSTVNNSIDNIFIGINGSNDDNIIRSGTMEFSTNVASIYLGQQNSGALAIYGQNYYIDGAIIDCGTW